jgi:hypothetical protein
MTCHYCRGDGHRQIHCPHYFCCICHNHAPKHLTIYCLLQSPYSFLIVCFLSIPLCFHITSLTFHLLPFHLAVSSCFPYLWLVLTHFPMNLPFLYYYPWSVLTSLTYVRTWLLLVFP